MIADLLEGSRGELAGDVCIVGSGVAGIALASSLASPSRKVILVESGGLHHEDETQSLYDAAITGKRFGSALTGRFRVHGGTSTKWGGQALPFFPIDFERRPWVANSGWPVDFREVEAYYPDAARFLEIDGLDFKTDLLQHLDRRLGGFDSAKIADHYSKWSPVPDLRPRYRNTFKTDPSITLLLHANLVDMKLDDSRSRLTHTVFKSLTGQLIDVRATVFILCLGGIETPRALLAARTQMPDGMGNAHGLVGRYFQDHPTTTIGTFHPRDRAAFQRLANVSEKAGLRYSYRMSASPDLQRGREILNASASFSFPSAPSLQRLKDAYRLSRQGRLGPAAVNFLRAALHPLQIAGPLYHFLRHKRVFTPGDRFDLLLMTEQEPNPQSRVVLSDRKDALGVPRAEIQWKLSDLSLHTVRVYAQVLKAELELAGHGKLDLLDWIDDPGTDWPDRLSDMNHHMGSTRMGETPRQGVVDTNLMVHGVGNLYVASSSVFPTGGHSNPTFTMLALCYRLSEHLKGILTGP